MAMNGFIFINPTHLIITDPASAFLLTINHKTKVRTIFQQPAHLPDHMLRAVSPVQGTNDHWILTSFVNENQSTCYKLYLFNCSTLQTNEVNFKTDLGNTIEVKFNFDGKYVFVGEGSFGKVESVKIFSYALRKEILIVSEPCSCSVINQVIYVVGTETIKVLDANSLQEVTEIEN